MNTPNEARFATLEMTDSRMSRFKDEAEGI